MKISLPGTLLLWASLSLTAHLSGQALQITSPTNLTAGSVNVFYSYTFTASGANGNTLIWTAPNGTPGGLTLDESGLLSGIPKDTAKSFQVQAAYSNGAQKTLLTTFNFTAAPATLGITTFFLPDGTQGVSYSTAITGTGGTPPYAWSITSSGVPGLSLDPNSGILSGIPTQVGTFPITVALVDSDRNSDSRPLQITIDPPGGGGPVITSSAALPNAEQYAPYTFAFTATGGDNTYTWNVPSGSSLPPGLTLSSAGVLAGTPTVGAGTYSFGVQVFSGEGAADQTVILTIVAPVSISTSSPLPAVDLGSPYSFAFSMAGGQGPFSWSIDSSAPPGLSIDPATGVLSGTPTAAGLFTFGVTISDNLNGTATGPFQITVNPALAILSLSPLTSGEAGLPYSFQFAASGGSGSYTWSVPEGSSLPAGLTLSASGVLSGTPTSAQSASFGITVVDTAGGSVTRTFQLQISAALAIASNSPLQPGTVGTAYSFTFQGSGGSGSYTWSLPSGSTLPAGLTLGAGGVLSGTPSGKGNFSFAVQVTDSPTGIPVSKTFALDITSTFAINSPANLPDGTVSVFYGEQLATRGGFGSAVWSLQSGTLPPGISLSASGLLSGTPTSAAASSFTVQAVDGASPQDTDTKTFALDTVAGLTIHSGSPLPGGVVGSAYSFTFQGVGGSAPSAYAWALATGSGPLPGGLSLGPSGILSGTPTGTGHFVFTVQLTDTQLSNVVTKAFALDVTSNFAISSPSNLPSGTVGGATYSQQLATTGGFGSVVWSLPSGSTLPPGITLSSSGLLSGPASTAGTYNFTVQAADGASPQDTATKAFTVQIIAGLAINSLSPLPAGTVASPYSFTFQASGGSGSYTWSLTSGSGPLPGGLSLNLSGVLSGRPSGIGSFSFTVQVTDTQRTISKAFTLDVASNFTITSPANLPAGAVRTAYSEQLTSSGGFGTVTWSVLSGTLPPGVALSASGLLSGTTSSTAGTYNFTAKAVDSATPQQDTATKALSVQIAAGLTISSSSPLAPGTVASPYSFTFVAVGGSGSYTWSKSSGSLPAGLSVDNAGTLSGTPSGTGHFSFVIRVDDTQRETSAAKTFALDIASNFTITNPTALPSVAAGASYGPLQLTSTGGFAPVTWTLSSGTLPAGITLSASGMLSGTASIVGTSNFTVQAVDSANPQDTATKPLRIQVFAVVPPVRVASPVTLSGQLGTPYTFTFSATGGTLPYTWAVASGTLPSGFILSPSGVLSGTPSGVGPYSFTVQVMDVERTAASQAEQLQFTLPPGPPLKITGIPANPPANSQPTFQVTIPTAYSFDIQGTLTLTFSSPSGVNDPAIQFTNGTRSLAFTIPAGATTAIFATGETPMFLTGTIAGTITLTVTQYQALGTSLTPIPAPVQVVIAPTAPVITSITATRSGSGFTVTIVGFSPTRELTGGTFSFLGSNLNTPQLSLDLNSLFQSWYSSATSDQFGSQFKLTQPFNLQGGSGNVKTVSITLTNSIGTSQLASAQVE